MVPRGGERNRQAFVSVVQDELAAAFTAIPRTERPATVLARRGGAMNAARQAFVSVVQDELAGVHSDHPDRAPGDRGMLAP